MADRRRCAARSSMRLHFPQTPPRELQIHHAVCLELQRQRQLRLGIAHVAEWSREVKRVAAAAGERNDRENRHPHSLCVPLNIMCSSTCATPVAADFIHAPAYQPMATTTGNDDLSFTTTFRPLADVRSADRPCPHRGHADSRRRNTRPARDSKVIEHARTSQEQTE